MRPTDRIYYKKPIQMTLKSLLILDSMTITQNVLYILKSEMMFLKVRPLSSNLRLAPNVGDSLGASFELEASGN